jgi:hypothetical protein
VEETPSRGRSRPSMGGSASATQAGCLREDDETARRRAWGGIRGIRLFHIKPLVPGSRDFQEKRQEYGRYGI